MFSSCLSILDCPFMFKSERQNLIRNSGLSTSGLHWRSGRICPFWGEGREERNKYKCINVFIFFSFLTVKNSLISCLGVEGKRGTGRQCLDPGRGRGGLGRWGSYSRIWTLIALCSLLIQAHLHWFSQVQSPSHSVSGLSLHSCARVGCRRHSSKGTDWIWGSKCFLQSLSTRSPISALPHNSCFRNTRCLQFQPLQGSTVLTDLLLIGFPSGPLGQLPFVHQHFRF